MQQEDIHQYRLSVKRWKAAGRHAPTHLALPDIVQNFYRNSGAGRDLFICSQILQKLPKRLRKISDIYLDPILLALNTHTDSIEPAPPIVPPLPPVAFAKVKATLQNIKEYPIDIHNANALHDLRKMCKDLVFLSQDESIAAAFQLDAVMIANYKKWSTELGDIHDLFICHQICRKLKKKNKWAQPESQWLLSYLKAQYLIQAILFAAHFSQKRHHFFIPKKRLIPPNQTAQDHTKPDLQDAID